MSFLHNLYEKVIPDGRSRRTNSFISGNDISEAPVFEELDGEDGFVVYTQLTEETSTASSRQTYDQRLEYNTLQTNSIPGNYKINPSGYSLSCSSKTNLIARGVKEHPSSTFLTVSDIPLKLSKPLEMIHNSTKCLSNYSPHPIDIGDYLYDFDLERTVLNSKEGNTDGKRW